MPDNAHDLIDERLEAMEREITEIYTRTEAEIEKTADEYFRKFKKLDDQKRRQVEAGKLSEEEYLEWKKNKVLYSKRFTEMKQHCAEQILNVNQTAVAYLNGKLPEMYALGYNDLKTAVDGIGGYTFTLISPDTVKRLITDNRSLLPLKAMNPAKDIPWNMKNINAEVLQGILQGESMDKIARRIRNVQEMNRTSAIRTARTAVTGAENKGRQDSYKRAEKDGIILKKEWIATFDMRTRHAHALLDGQLADQDKPFKSELGDIMYPGDPNAHPSNVYNCRCTTAAKIMGFRKKNSDNALTDDNKSDIIVNNSSILSPEETISKAKLLAKDADYDNVHSFQEMRAVTNSKLGYDGLPKIMNSTEFDMLAKEKTILYRGIQSGNGKSVNEIAHELKYGNLWTGNTGGAVYGNGVYFTASPNIAKSHYASSNGVVIEAILDESSKIADYKTIYQEFFDTGIPKIIGKREDYQYIIGDVGQYAAVKGYDAIALNGYQNHDYIVLLNRTKAIIKE